MADDTTSSPGSNPNPPPLPPAIPANPSGGAPPFLPPSAIPNPPNPRPPSRGMPVWAIVLIVCAALMCPLAILAGMLLPALARAKQKAERINCVSHLKQVGLAFRLWSDDNTNQFPFNVSAKFGGTLEYCQPGPDGLDRNSWRHFQVMSNELGTPKILVCPSDTAAHPAVSFSQLQAGNVTYLIHSGTNVSETYPQGVLAICPIHHNVVFCDGSVQALASESQMRQLLARPPP